MPARTADGLRRSQAGKVGWKTPYAPAADPHQRVVVQPAHHVSEHREEGNVEGQVWACVLVIALAGLWRCFVGASAVIWPGAPNAGVAFLVVRDLARDIDDELTGAAEDSDVLWPLSGSLK